MKKSVKAIGVSGLLVGGLALGSVLSPISFASAQDDTDPSIEAPAGESAEQGRSGPHHQGRLGTEVLDRMVEDGVIDQATADDIAEWLEADKAERQAEHEARRTEHLETVAGYIGISTDDLQAALEEGQSLAEIAEANAKDVDELVDELVADATADIQERATEHDIPEEQVEQMLENVEERVEARVNGEGGPRGPHGPRGPRGPRGGPGGVPDTEA
ncbi:MAG: hypothetical protein GY713_20440 [Actinomycetia bacterium]|nr:hypothetical protein [Actinomycetes bacterium]